MAGKTDPDGVPLFDMITEVARSGKAATIAYACPGHSCGASEARISSVKAFQPWAWAYGAGIYLNGVDEAFSAGLLKTRLVAAVVLTVSALLALLVAGGIVRQLGGELSCAVGACVRLPRAICARRSKTAAVPAACWAP